jgi:hypothetical protein
VAVDRSSATTACGLAWTSTLTSSVAVKPGSSGTATSPARAAPNSATKNSGVLKLARIRRSPGDAPPAASEAAKTDARRSSSA